MSAHLSQPTLADYIKGDLPWHRGTVECARNPWTIAWDENQQDQRYFRFTAQRRWPSKGYKYTGVAEYSVPAAYIPALTELLFPAILQENLQQRQRECDRERDRAVLKWHKDGCPGPEPSRIVAAYSNESLRDWWQSILVLEAFFKEMGAWKTSSDGNCFIAPEKWRSKVLHCWLWRQYMLIGYPKHHYPSGRTAFKMYLEKHKKTPYKGDIVRQYEIRSNDVRSLLGQDHRRVLGRGNEEPEESRSRERTQTPAIDDLSSFVSTVEARSTGELAPCRSSSGASISEVRSILGEEEYERLEGADRGMGAENGGERERAEVVAGFDAQMDPPDTSLGEKLQRNKPRNSVPHDLKNKAKKNKRRRLKRNKRYYGHRMPTNAL